MYYGRLIISLTIVLFSCKKFELSLYQIPNDKEYQNINDENISRFINTDTDTVTIALIGDSQRFYDATNKTIARINNTPNIDFVIHTGDIVDFGLYREYVWMHELLSSIVYPYIAVVGNHDLIANGGEIYNQMYGDYDFSFTYNGNKFIYVNTNSREFSFDNNVPNIEWLDSELSDTLNYNNAIIVCHVSQMDDDFNSNLKDEFTDVLRKYRKVLLSINGHKHDFSFIEPGDDNISYINTYSSSHEKFILIKIWDTSFSFEIIEK